MVTLCGETSGSAGLGRVTLRPNRGFTAVSPRDVIPAQIPRLSALVFPVIHRGAPRPPRATDSWVTSRDEAPSGTVIQGAHT